ncbi:MAG TPA: hypothetical protein VIL20_11735, partial [Sandaracinaceae bacterium]
MDERGRGLGRALEAFANAVLERTLPRIRQWLAVRLGPRAELASLELDGARVHLIGARIPLGPRATLHAARATFATRAEDLAFGLPPISLERLEGRLELPGDRSADVVVEGAPARSADEWVAGTVTLRELRIAGRVYDGTAEVRLTSARFGIERARLASAGSELRLDAEGSFEGGGVRVARARLEAGGIPLVVLTEAIAALSGARAPALPISSELAVRGRCELREDGSFRGDLRASDGGAKAELAIEGRVERGALSGRVRGTIAPSLFANAHASLDGRPIDLEGALGGTLARPRAEVVAHGSALALRSARGELRASRLRATASFDPDRGLELDAHARVDRGRAALSVRGGSTRLTLERVGVAPLFAFLPPRAQPLVRALALGEGQLWADVRVHGDAIEGAAHLESPRASVTLEPLHLRRRDRAIEASTLRASLDPAGLPLAGVIELELALDGTMSGPSARGVLRSRALAVTLGDRRPAELRDVLGRVLVEDGELHLLDVRASAFGGTVRGTATLSARGAIVRELFVDQMGEALVRWALSDGPSAPLGPMRGLAVSGVLAREAGALRGALRAETATSALSLRAVIADDGALAGSALEGTLGLVDLEPPIARRAFVPARNAAWRIEGTLDGTLAAPRLDLTASCERQPVLVAARDGWVELVAEDVRVRASATRERIAWSEAAARAYGGVLRSRGSVAFSGAASARLELDGVRVEALPLWSTGGGACLAGALGGTVDLWRPHGGATVGCGRLFVHEPEYPIVQRAAALAARLSLPLPDRRGVGPLSLT